MSVRNNRITELQILEKNLAGYVRENAKPSLLRQKKQAKYITGIKNRPNTLWKIAVHYGLKIKKSIN